MAYRLFISYRRNDSAGYAGRVHDRLQQEFGRDFLFMDVDSIPLGANFAKVLGDEVAKCDVLLAMIGPGWLDAHDENGNRRLENADDFVRIEVGTALKRSIPVIPILLDGAQVPKASQLPDDLKELALRNGLDVRHASFGEDMQRLIRRLKGAPQQPASVTPRRLHTLAWNFLSKDKNRAVLGWLGAGVVVVIGALWAAFVYFMPASKPGSPAPGVEAEERLVRPEEELKPQQSKPDMTDQGAKQEASEPAALAGSWSGGGTFVYVSGQRERARCQASYSGGSSSVMMSASCATPSGSVIQSARLRRVGANSYAGSFFNSQDNTAGTINVMVHGNTQSISLRSSAASASLTLRRDDRS
jgi:hypothetical protein